MSLPAVLTLARCAARLHSTCRRRPCTPGQPRCDHLARSGRNASKGSQFLLWQAQQHESLEEALQDAALSVACTRWVAGELLAPAVGRL